MEQFGFSFDMSRCSGCMACVVACMDQNDLNGDGPSFRQVVRLEKGEYPDTRLSFVSLACFHCSDAPCMNVCPKSAISVNPEKGMVVNEINHTMEFHSAQPVSGVNIADEIVNYVVEVAKRK